MYKVIDLSLADKYEKKQIKTFLHRYKNCNRELLAFFFNFIFWAFITNIHTIIPDLIRKVR